MKRQIYQAKCNKYHQSAQYLSWVRLCKSLLPHVLLINSLLAILFGAESTRAKTKGEFSGSHEYRPGGSCMYVRFFKMLLYLGPFSFIRLREWINLWNESVCIYEIQVSITDTVYSPISLNFFYPWWKCSSFLNFLIITFFSVIAIQAKRLHQKSCINRYI